MAGFLFRLETPEGAPADPPTLASATPNWRPGTRSLSDARRCAWYRPATTMQTGPRC
jgi:hypothetical protein